MPSSEKFLPLFGLVAWLAICFITAAVGAIASLQAESFYAALAQPDWAPPASALNYSVWQLNPSQLA
jgi:translocator protein